MRIHPANISHELVERLYVGEGKSVMAVGQIIGKSARQVSRYLKKFGIEARPFHSFDFQRGHQVRLGAVLSDVSKEKIRAKALGRKIPPEVRMKMGSKGSKNPGYIDGRTPANKLIRHSVEYRLWREAVFLRDNYTCQNPECGKRGGDMHADHIKPFALYPELRLAIDNGRTLCVDCHRDTPTYGYKLNTYNN